MSDTSDQLPENTPTDDDTGAEVQAHSIDSVLGLQDTAVDEPGGGGSNCISVLSVVGV